MSLGAGALDYAARGLPVFPLKQGTKKPAIPRSNGGHGFLDATCDETTLRTWWEQRFPKANVGLATGKAGLFVVDVDTGKPEASAEDKRRAFEFVIEHGLDGAPVIVETPSGGRHYYFRKPSSGAPSKQDAFGLPLVDLRADGGYVVAPPSTTDVGAYSFADEPDFEALTEPPDSLLALLNGNGRQAAQPVSETIPQGQRNGTLTSLAGTMRRRGMGEEAIAAALLAENERSCDPALSKTEVRSIARSVSQYEPAPTPEPVETRPEEGDAEPRLAEPSTWAVAQQTVSEVTWLWPEWLPRGYATVLAGDTGSGKTWVALALAGMTTAGSRWPDQAAGGEPGLCFWLEAEGRLRVNFQRAAGMDLDLEGFLGMPEPFRAYYLDDERDFEQIAAMVRHVRPALVVVDSWNRAYSGKEDSSETRHTVDRVQRLAEETDSAWLLLQHLRKPTEADGASGNKVHRVRGSSALYNVALSVIGVEQVPGPEKQWCLTVWKSNLCERDPEPLGFTIRDGQVCFGEAPAGATETGTETRLEEAREFLLTVLADGPVLVPDVRTEAKSVGIAKETLERAKREVAEARRTRGTPTRWYWALRGFDWASWKDA